MYVTATCIFPATIGGLLLESSYSGDSFRLSGSSRQSGTISSKAATTRTCEWRVPQSKRHSGKPSAEWIATNPRHALDRRLRHHPCCLTQPAAGSPERVLTQDSHEDLLRAWQPELSVYMNEDNLRRRSSSSHNRAAPEKCSTKFETPTKRLSETIAISKSSDSWGQSSGRHRGESCISWSCSRSLISDTDMTLRTTCSSRQCKERNNEKFFTQMNELSVALTYYSNICYANQSQTLKSAISSPGQTSDAFLNYD